MGSLLDKRAKKSHSLSKGWSAKTEKRHLSFGGECSGEKSCLCALPTREGGPVVGETPVKEELSRIQRRKE